MASLQAAASRGVAVDRKAGAASVVAHSAPVASSAKAAAALVAGAAPAPKAVKVSA
jgi:hypothetical protein